MLLGQDNELCCRCAQISFEHLLAPARAEDIHRETVCLLNGISGDSNCRLCRFFWAVRCQPPYPISTSQNDSSFRRDTNTYRLEATPVDFDGPHRSLLVRINIDAYRGQGVDNGGMILQIGDRQGVATGRHIQPFIEFDIPRQWLSVCQRDHQTFCSQNGDNRLPKGFRVIDCERRNLILWDDIGGFEDTDDPKNNGFVTLSYVWGSNFEGAAARTTRNLPGDLPATIEDTMSVCKLLGFRFLWLDRYCIPQDDPELRQVQIEAMDTIYAQSALTVIAAAGADPSHGLPGVSHRLRHEQPAVRISDQITLAFCPISVQDDISRSVWETRGWTFQEGLLGRRRLVFTDTQVYFQCQTMHCLESISTPLGRIWTETRHGRNVINISNTGDYDRCFPILGLGRSPNAIASMIDSFTQKELTFETDTLNAMQGIFNTYQRTNHYGLGRSTRILEGLPLLLLAPLPVEPSTIGGMSSTSYPDENEDKLNDVQELAFGLCWHENISPPNRKCEKPIDYHDLRRRPGFPSWTWAGWHVRGFQPCSLVQGLGESYSTIIDRHGRYPRTLDTRTTQDMLEVFVEDVHVIETSGNGDEVYEWTAYWADTNLMKTKRNAGSGSTVKKHVERLRLHGPCLDVRVSSTIRKPRSLDETGLVYEVDWFQMMVLANSASLGNPGHISAAGMGEVECIYDFTLLLLAQDVFEYDKPRVHVLVLLRRWTVVGELHATDCCDDDASLTRLVALEMFGDFFPWKMQERSPWNSELSKFKGWAMNNVIIG